ncbi:NAD(P)H-hydrate epimerase [Methanocalculus chunghsingensis]|uniref:ADP-dependent (S)-NAD(P)H-hydrate dehydratase n=1 Tax=Methanocalculus chunghsingensis TaxID=156457 RepID=A0A8J8B437_9EURY|nr:NAD(P)H-hydrate dehydratase [Methanocalculus chunghsingensis]MBR1368905.1 NAD(P)H-hydrate epimerase [Methanocalculus chunghsingensis]
MPYRTSEWVDEGPVTPRLMQVIERNAVALGVSTLQMMESAGKALADRALIEAPDHVLLLCGKGNNGGDGFVAARYLARHTEVTCICLSGERQGDAATNLLALRRCGIPIHEISCRDDLLVHGPLFSSADLIIDALIGTGSAGILREPVATCVRLAGESDAFILSADLPTPGISPDCILAFHRSKGGATEAADIGIPIEAECCTGPGDLLLIPAKQSSAHKGAGGKVLIIGGGPYQGAPYLAGLAALRAGADIVRVATPCPLDYPDIIHIPVGGTILSEADTEMLIADAEEADVVLIGPGMGSKSQNVAVRVAEAARRVVIDADALRLPLPVGGETIYTPHAGEFARIFGRSPEGSSRQRARLVSAAASETRVVLLKGKIDIVSDGRRVRFNRTGHPAMTVGGTGDLLAGIAAGLFCRMSAFEAASVAAYANGVAGESAAAGIGDGMIAGDLLPFIARILYGELY